MHLPWNSLYRCDQKCIQLQSTSFRTTFLSWFKCVQLFTTAEPFLDTKLLYALQSNIGLLNSQKCSKFTIKQKLTANKAEACSKFLAYVEYSFKYGARSRNAWGSFSVLSRLRSSSLNFSKESKLPKIPSTTFPGKMWDSFNGI